MDMNLIPYDMEQFFKKYTRFMTKKIYIDQALYQRFLNQYDYLYQELEQNTFLYQNNPIYQKIMDIKKNKKELIKLHNQKYLKDQSQKYQSFFDALYPKDILDMNKRYTILSEEPYLLVIMSKNIIPLIDTKIKYLLKTRQISEQNILILVDHEERLHLIKEGLNHSCNIHNIKTISSLSRELLNSPTKLLEEKQKYQILKDYLIHELFPQKEKFQKLYSTFENAIYLNKDYKEYDTFKDYHNYMYKRMFLSTGLSLKKYNEQEINKRKKYLRTINNETTNTKEEVDIANFFYLNSIDYKYHQKTSSFIIKNNQKTLIFQFKNQLEDLKDNNQLKETYKQEEDIIQNISKVIKLYANYQTKTTFLEKLVYELINERYPLEKMSEETIYERLKATTIDSYFHELIMKYFLPAIEQYQKTGTIQNSDLTQDQKQELITIYDYYKEYLNKHHLIEETSLKPIVEDYLTKNNYQYLFLIGDISLNPKIEMMHIKDNYEEIELVKENVKLMYDYKKYLHEKKSLPTLDTYKSIFELSNLTKEFLKDNLKKINQKLEENQNTIYIYPYEDSNRLKNSKTITKFSSKIIEQIPDKKELLIAVNHLSEINPLLIDSPLSKLDKNTMITNKKEKFHYEEICKLEKNYSHILLPYLIPDRYHEDPFTQNKEYQIKLKLYIAITYCKNNIYLLCPNSKLSKLTKRLEKLKTKIIYLEE